jgi:hypothetical protein
MGRQKGWDTGQQGTGRGRLKQRFGVARKVLPPWTVVRFCGGVLAALAQGNDVFGLAD